MNQYSNPRHASRLNVPPELAEAGAVHRLARMGASVPVRVFRVGPAHRPSSGSSLAASCRLVLTRWYIACCLVIQSCRGPLREHAMRRQGGKFVEMAATATRSLRAAADRRSAYSAQEGRCERCWRPGSSMVPSRRWSNPVLRSSILPWQDAHHEGELHDLAHRSDDTEAVSAKQQGCPHLAVYAHPDGTLETGATEMDATIRCPLKTLKTLRHWPCTFD